MATGKAPQAQAGFVDMAHVCEACRNWNGAECSKVEGPMQETSGCEVYFQPKAAGFNMEAEQEIAPTNEDQTA